MPQAYRVPTDQAGPASIISRVLDVIDEERRAVTRMARCSVVNADGTIRSIRANQTVADAVDYRVLAPYRPQIGDEVAHVRIGRHWYAVGAVNATGGVIARDPAGTTVNNDAGESSMFSAAVRADIMTTVRMLRWTGWGTLLNNTGAGQTIRLRAKFGGVTWWDSNVSPAYAASASRRGVYAQVHLANVTATNLQRGGGVLSIGEPGGAAVGVGDLQNTAIQSDAIIGTAAAGAIDTTAAQTFEITAQLGAANANLEIAWHYGVLELV